MDEFIVGKHPEGWVCIEMRLETKAMHAQTVEHDEVNAVTEFAASGSIWPRRNSPDCTSAGQMLNDLWRTKPVGPWTTTDLFSLWAVWERWHLNAMRGACAHQTVLHESSQGYDRPDLDGTKPCLISGYKYGTSWLYEPIPELVQTEMHRLYSLLISGERWADR